MERRLLRSVCNQTDSPRVCDGSAVRRTEWLEDSFVLDKKGFIVTGPDLAEYNDFEWPLSCPPLLLETSVPGVFAVGDIRAGSVKQVTSAVGEGAMAVHLVHRFLAASAERSSA